MVAAYLEIVWDIVLFGSSCLQQLANQDSVRKVDHRVELGRQHHLDLWNLEVGWFEADFIIVVTTTESTIEYLVGTFHREAFVARGFGQADLLQVESFVQADFLKADQEDELQFKVVDQVSIKMDLVVFDEVRRQSEIDEHQLILGQLHLEYLGVVRTKQPDFSGKVDSFNLRVVVEIQRQVLVANHVIPEH